MLNMKSLSLTVQKLWPRLKVFGYVSPKVTVKVTSSNLLA